MFRLRYLLVVTVALTFAGACGGGDPGASSAGTPDQDAADAVGSGADSEAAPEAASEAAGAVEARDFCSLLTRDEIEQAFDGEIPLGEMEGDDSRCFVEVTMAPGNGFVWRRISRATYDRYRGYEDQSGISFESIDDLGIEAHVVNDNQVNVLLSEEEAITVGMQLVVVGQELPLSEERIREGVVELARKVVERL